jgi:hypothetical protein
MGNGLSRYICDGEVPVYHELPGAAGKAVRLPSEICAAATATAAPPPVLKAAPAAPPPTTPPPPYTPPAVTLAKPELPLSQYCMSFAIHFKFANGAVIRKTTNRNRTGELSRIQIDTAFLLAIDINVAPCEISRCKEEDTWTGEHDTALVNVMRDGDMNYSYVPAYSQSNGRTTPRGMLTPDVEWSADIWFESGVISKEKPMHTYVYFKHALADLGDRARENKSAV